MKQPIILALDTSTEACSAAVVCNGELFERHELLPRGHAQHILGMADAVLADAGLALGALDAISFCRGPGSFTGVRIAAAVAQGLAFGAGVPVAPVSTLACLAQGAWERQRHERILAAIDARMGEVYWGVYRIQSGVAVLCGEETVVAPEHVRVPDEDGWHGVGTGWASYPESLGARGRTAAVEPAALPRAADCLPLAAAMWRGGQLVEPEQALPVYLRDKVTG